MQTFVRMSKLSDIVGRSDYISNPERQEDIVAAKCYADWKQYQAYERKHQRSNTPNNEGRELIIALPNEWTKFDDLNMTTILHSDFFRGNMITNGQFTGIRLGQTYTCI